jgi:mRNA-degrading endonuclease RelE of RelBE toxin-antitoxin system
VANRDGRSVPDDPSAESSAADNFKVYLTASAEAAYLALRRRASEAATRGESSDPAIATFVCVDTLLRHTLPKNPFQKDYSLHKPFSELYRFDRGRLRIAWLVNGEARTVTVAFISNTPCREANAAERGAILKILQQQGFVGSVVDDFRRATHVPPSAPVN